MKKSLVAVCSLAVLALASASAFAGEYKSAGCGLGSMLIKDDGIVQIFAATTNGTFGNQTFGITSGTSNCSGPGGYAKADAEKEMYLSSNLDQVTQEMAQGSGEHLSALASLMGCSQTSVTRFGAVMKQNYSQLATQTTAEKMINAVQTRITADPQLSAGCHG